jgi:5-methylthioadenosine/S-adenosylhomocysteine deaminase
VLGDNGGAMIWSPLSNLLLYGQSADVGAAKQSGVRIGVGSDWSPSGSKNLFGELKVARLMAQEQGLGFSDCELLAMATREAAGILGWDGALGSIEAGKRADLLVAYGRSGDPYAQLLQAGETAIGLVVVDGVPRSGNERLMNAFGLGTEGWQVGSADRVLNLAQKSANPVVGALSLREARERLRDGLGHLPELARRLEEAAPQRWSRLPSAQSRGGSWLWTTRSLRASPYATTCHSKRALRRSRRASPRSRPGSEQPSHPSRSCSDRWNRTP